MQTKSDQSCLITGLVKAGTRVATRPPGRPGWRIVCKHGSDGGGGGGGGGGGYDRVPSLVG